MTSGPGVSAPTRPGPFAYRRIYDEALPDDGTRVLVDRVWPRGLHREDARLDVWLRDVAPSTQLRLWYGHDPARFAEFRRRYLDELTSPDREQAVEELFGFAARGPVTLLTASRDLGHSQAAVLAQWLAERLGAGAAGLRRTGRP